MFTYCKTPKISNVIPIMGFYLAAKATLVALKKKSCSRMCLFTYRQHYIKLKLGQQMFF